MINKKLKKQKKSQITKEKSIVLLLYDTKKNC